MPLLFILAIPTVALSISTLAIRGTTPGILATIINFILTTVAEALLGTAAVYALDQIDRGNAAGVLDACTVAISRARDLIFASAWATVVPLLFCLTIVGIPWGVAKFVSWSFTREAIMVDGNSGNGALDLSHDLVSGRGWRTAWALFCFAMVWVLPVTLLDLFAFFVLDVEPLIRRSLILGTTIVLFPFSVASHLLLYYDLKMRKGLA